MFLGTVKWTDSLVVDGSVDSNMLYLGRDRYYWAFECVRSGIKMKQGGVLSVICRFHDLIVQRLGDIIRDIGLVRDRAFKNVGLLDIAVYVSLLVYFEKFVTSSCIHRTRYSA